MYWLFWHRVARVRQLKIWCILIILGARHSWWDWRAGDILLLCLCGGCDKGNCGVVRRMKRTKAASGKTLPL